jgi:hypothetical protein
MKKFQNGDLVDTITNGILLIRAGVTIQPNNDPRTDKLGGRTIYWAEDMDGQDLILWDTELNAVLTEGELLA